MLTDADQHGLTPVFHTKRVIRRWTALGESPDLVAEVVQDACGVVLDERTLAIPEATGNKRLDTGVT